MAMAPMHTVKDAVTKALTKPLSLAFPVFRFSHSPNRSKAPSMFSASPITPPMARHPMISMAPLLTMALPSTESICSSAPVMAINNVLTPQTLVKVSWVLSLKNRPNSAPSTPPVKMAAVLIMVPRPNIITSPRMTLRLHLTATGKKCQ